VLGEAQQRLYAWQYSSEAVLLERRTLVGPWPQRC
jgi:hypothetical protein